MTDPTAIDFDALAWEDEAPGPDVRREEWCTDGHRGWVITGAIEYEFDDGHAPLRAITGEAFRLPGGVGHRGRNLENAPTQLFLIDDPAH